MKWFLFAIFFFTIPALAYGTTYYVATTGSNSNPGTAAQPFKTIQHAADVVVPGDVVVVRAGTYTITPADTGQTETGIYTRASGRPTARIVYKSEAPYAAKIVTSGIRRVWSNGMSGTQKSSYVDIQGFDISGDGTIGIVNYASNVQIIGNYIHDVTSGLSCDQYGGAGILQTNSASTDNNILGNLVMRIGLSCQKSPGAHGIYFGYGDGIIANNLVGGNAHFGIHIYPTPGTVLIANNTTFRNGVIGTTAAGAPVVNCNLCTVENNISYGNPYGFREYQGGKNQYINNLVYANNLQDWYITTNSTITGTVMENPQFVNYKADGTGDYRIQATSPAVDAGVTVTNITIDLTGTSRPKGTAYDIGAYEYVVSGSSDLLTAPTNLQIGSGQ